MGMTIIEGFKQLSEGQALYAFWKEKKVLIADWQWGKSTPRFISDMPGPVPLSIGQLNGSVAIVRVLPRPPISIEVALKKAFECIELSFSCEKCEDRKECKEGEQSGEGKLCFKDGPIGREIALERAAKALKGLTIDWPQNRAVQP